MSIFFPVSHPGPPPVMPEQEKCGHMRLRFVWRIFAGKNQVKRYGFQCLDCGDAGYKDHAGNMTSAATWCGYKKCREYFDCDYTEAVSMHDSLTKHFEDQRRAYWDRKYQERQNHKGEWWDWYNRYLECDDWKGKRRRVLERDGFKCCVRGCERSAEQVHHLTYARVGYELLDDLISVCGVCHELVHSGELL